MLTNSHTHHLRALFHLCVRLNHFAQSKALSFVPPDLRFALMEYRFDLSVSKPGAAPALLAAAAVQLRVQVPFTIRASLSTTDYGGVFEVSFTPRAGALDDVAVELYFGSSPTRERPPLCLHDLWCHPLRLGAGSDRDAAHPRAANFVRAARGRAEDRLA
ncbi:hypothetical protein BJY52DRAFT_897477 [Lactarius psammicola]|nr:hypothetical protein BJY52DRAFT_897477 [Lactarius psammicola]